jgi:hypothetical protein
MGMRPDLVEAQLVHKDPDSVRMVYNRAEYLNERREMMQTYADYLDGLMPRASMNTAKEQVGKIHLASSMPNGGIMMSLTSESTSFGKISGLSLHVECYLGVFPFDVIDQPVSDSGFNLRDQAYGRAVLLQSSGQIENHRLERFMKPLVPFIVRIIVLELQFLLVGEMLYGVVDKKICCLYHLVAMASVLASPQQFVQRIEQHLVLLINDLVSGFQIAGPFITHFAPLCLTAQCLRNTIKSSLFNLEGFQEHAQVGRVRACGHIA